MRLISLAGLLVVAVAAGLALGSCQVRNFARCQEPDYPCEAGFLCKTEQGAASGTCQPECGAGTAGQMTACPDDHPICTSGGSCGLCTGDDQCLARNSSFPRCSKAGLCVTCSQNSDCKDSLSPVCDTTSNTCRPCTLHRECSDGICVKDDTLAALPTGKELKKGQCVPATRQVAVDSTSCPSGCTLQSKFDGTMGVSVDRPYLKISNFKSSLKLRIGVMPTSLPVIHVVTDSADLSPALYTAAPTNSLSDGADTALLIDSGANVVLEGVNINLSQVGLQCTGTTGNPTTVRVLRSLFSENKTGINASNCDLKVEDSWIGTGVPGAASRGNSLAMSLDSTKFEIVDSVFFSNVAAANVFSGITLRNTAGAAGMMPGRIVNTTFAKHENADGTKKALAVDCTSYNIGNNLTIVNSLFLNEAAPTSGNRYVGTACGTSTYVTNNGSDDTTLTGTGSATDLKYADVFVAPPNLRVKAAAATLVGKGVTTYTDSKGAVTIPTKDLDGRARPTNNVAFGAFEPVP